MVVCDFHEPVGLYLMDVKRAPLSARRTIDLRIQKAGTSRGLSSWQYGVLGAMPAASVVWEFHGWMALAGNDRGYLPGATAIAIVVSVLLALLATGFVLDSIRRKILPGLSRRERLSFYVGFAVSFLVWVVAV
ncbi:MAG: hypothetical protein K6V73_07680 [Firmicutes bacterium]|nr:hypothetical protein [Bacillota bacterium]